MNPKPTVENPLNAMLPVIASAVEQWRTKHTPEQLESRVTTLLNSKSDEIVAKMLGFNYSYGRWELDHCNGRSGNSAAGDYMRQCHKDAIEKWLAKVTMPVLPKVINQQLRKSLQAEFNRSLEKALCDKVVAYANEEASRMFKELEVPSLLDNYMQTLQLIKKE